MAVDECVSTVPIRSYRRNGIVFSSPTIGNGKAAKFIMATDKHKGKGMRCKLRWNDVNDVITSVCLVSIIPIARVFLMRGQMAVVRRWVPPKINGGQTSK